jgi:hypothetical protein
MMCFRIANCVPGSGILCLAMVSGLLVAGLI